MDLFGTNHVQTVSYPTEVVDYLETVVKPLYPTASINADIDAYHGMQEGVMTAVRANTHVLSLHDNNGEYWGVVQFFNNIWLCQF